MKSDSVFYRLARAAYPVFLFLLIRTVIVTVVKNMVIWASTADMVILGYDFSTIVTKQQLVDWFSTCSTYITIVSSVVNIIVFYFLYRKNGKGSFCHNGLKFPKAKESLRIIVLTATAGIGINNLIVLSNIASLSSKFQSTQEVLYSPSIFIELLGSGLIIPICEELVFRGVIYERLKLCVGTVLAGFFSALLFGVLHGNIVQGIFATIIGMLLAFLYEKYKSILVPIMGHMSINIFAIILSETQFVARFLPSATYYLLFTVACIVIAAFLFGSLTNKK